MFAAPTRSQSQLSALLVLLLITSFGLVESASAQDEGRYRPQGRQIGTAVGREFREQVYEVRIYDPQPAVAQFSKATIFYPLTLSFAPPYGAVVLVPGYRGTQDNYDWWGPALASLGMAVMIIDTNQPDDAFEARKQAHIAAVEFLLAENAKADSPIKGRIDTNKIAIMGHSLGGGAALAAAVELGDRIKAVVPLLPYCCELGQSFTGNYSDLHVPTLIFASAEDTVAPPAQHARALYDSIAADTPRVYAEFAKGPHTMATNTGEELMAMGRFTLAWLKLNLDGKANFADALTTLGSDWTDTFSRFEYKP